MKILLLFVFTIVLLSGETTAQCYPDRHNTTWFDGWISCGEAESPNPERGMSHWIMYDFAHQYELGQIHLWNSNDPKNLNQGVKEMIVDYSNDGENWSELGTYNIEMASGKTTYEGYDGPDFEGTEGRYLLLTAKNNWGGDCVGFSEIRIQVHGVNAVDEDQIVDAFHVVIYPNPFTTSCKAEITTKKHESISYRLIDVFGRQLKSGIIINPQASNYLNIKGTGLQAGVYYLIVQQGESLSRNAVVKVE